jgi:hypothetical protein
VVPSVKQTIKPWWVIGLVGALANLVLLGLGMGVAFGSVPVGLGLGYWIAHRARLLGDSDSDQVRRWALWGGIVAGGLAMHAEILCCLTILLLLGPAEMGRSITGELYGALPWMPDVLRWPALLDSIGAFWILQTFGFALTGYVLTVLSAWIWVKGRDKSEATHSSHREVPV